MACLCCANQRLHGPGCFFVFGSDVSASEDCGVISSYVRNEKDVGGEIFDRYVELFDSGLNNFKIFSGGDLAGSNEIIFSIFYPGGSYDPQSMRDKKLPVGGINSKVKLKHGYECLFLSYDIMFGSDFDFVEGGKLPGLAGGTANTGGKIPTGYDGFSARFLWLGKGGGAVYAYLPTSVEWGTALGAYKWSYLPGNWHHLTQKIVLNDVGKSNGVLKVWVDNELVHYQGDILYRRTDGLKIDSFLFSSFFGGNKPKFAAKADSFLYLKNIKISDRI